MAGREFLQTAGSSTQPNFPVAPDPRMENQKAQSQQHPEPRNGPGPVRSFLASVRSAFARLGSGFTKPAQANGGAPANGQERGRLPSPIDDLYRQIQSTHPRLFSLSFAGDLCSQLDCLLDDLPSRANSRERLPFLHDLVMARNEVVLTLDYLDPQEVDPLYRVVLRNQAILRLKEVLQRIRQAQQPHRSSEFARGTADTENKLHQIEA